jgi:N-acetylmuramic acid 6-phosphate etherase
MTDIVTIDLSSLPTEAINEATRDLSRVSTREALGLINNEDRKVAEAVGRVLDIVAVAVDGIAERLSKGGRLFYVGAGTSGRLGVVDASECPPTFGTPPELVQGIIAGGREAMFRSQERAEDNPETARRRCATMNSPVWMPLSGWLHRAARRM